MTSYMKLAGSAAMAIGTLLLLPAVASAGETAAQPAVRAARPVNLPAIYRSQQTPTSPRPIVPVRCDVVLSRFQGDKKISSLPFSLHVNANEMEMPSRPRITSLRMGVDVPIGTHTTTSPQGNTTSRPEYRYVGTQIDCGAETADDGRYRVEVRISDSSIFSADQEPRAAVRFADPAAFRTYSIQNRLTVRDGQMVQFSVATDKMTGEVLRAELTVTAIK